MKNKRTWLGMLVLMLAFGMTVVGCEDTLTNEDKLIGGKWRSVTNELTFGTNNVVSIWVMGWGTENFLYEVNGNKLKLTDSSGNSSTGTIEVEFDKGKREYNKLIISDFPYPPVSHHLTYIDGTYYRN